MKEYPKTYGFNLDYVGRHCWAFYKYDGSNLRFEYSRKQKKWYKFGTRRHLFAEGDKDYGASLPVFFNKYAEGLAKVFHDTKAWKSSENMIVFCEYFGPSSFSGQHIPEEPKDVVLFDVNVHKRGLLGPKEFINHFGHLQIAEVVYEGEYTQELYQNVREGVYNLFEGVMCKGGSGHDLWMSKIKTLSYLSKLQEMYAEKWEEYA